MNKIIVPLKIAFSDQIIRLTVSYKKVRDIEENIDLELKKLNPNFRRFEGTIYRSEPEFFDFLKKEPRALAKYELNWIAREASETINRRIISDLSSFLLDLETEEVAENSSVVDFKTRIIRDFRDLLNKSQTDFKTFYQQF